MNQIAKYPLTAAPLSRRGFVASVTAVAGAMSLGFTVPAEAQQAASGAPTSRATAARPTRDADSAGRGGGTRAAAGAGARARRPPPVKAPSQWKIIGKPVKRLDTAPKLTGEQIYAIDVKLPDMLNAAVAQCPVFGGTLVSFDAAKVSSMPGVTHVLKLDDHTVAVVADKWFQAKTALEALPIVWDEGPNAQVNSASIADFLKEGLDAKQ